MLHLHLEPHGAAFRSPSGLARLWVGATSFAVRTPGSFLQNRLCRAVPFAETAFPSLTPGWFLITALRNNSEAAGVTVLSVQLSGLVSSQSRATITTNDCGTSSSSFRETPVACGCPCCCPRPHPRSWEHTHLSVCLDLPVLDIHTNRICDLL